MPCSRQFQHYGPPGQVKMSVASAVAADVGESLNKLSFLRDHHPKTLDTGRNGRTVSCGAVGDVSFAEVLDSTAALLCEASANEFLTTIRFSN
jgi:hypothetical protein